MGVRIVLAGGLDADSEARLAAAGEVTHVAADDVQMLRAALVDADALVCRTHVAVTAELLAVAPRLRVIGVAGVGTDKVDLAAAAQRGIRVLTRPGAATQAVTELTLALLLNLLRPIGSLSARYRSGEFATARAKPHGRELRELTVGIVGCGRIGSSVGRLLATGFGCRVLYNDIVAVGPFDFAAERADKPTIWQQADVISLHVPLTDQTRGLVSTTVLADIAPTALLINTCRGAVVDTAAVTAALQAGKLGGFAADVTDPEPLPGDHPLFSLPNVVLTPHVAARTHRGIANMYAVVDDVVAALKLKQ